MLNPTRRQLEALAELKNRGGAVITSEWATGRGRFTTPRSIPPFCRRIENWAAFYQVARIRKVFRLHPRCSAVVAIVDMRRANRALAALEVQEPTTC